VVFGAIDSLVAKSMVVIHPIGAMMRYRLLDTTRAYALDIVIDAPEVTGLAERHAAYFRRWLEQARNEWEIHSTGTERAPYFAGLNNARAALEWCFGPTGNVEVGVGIAAAAAPVFFTMSLLPECLRWSERALQAVDKTRQGGSEEMQLQASLGLSLMYTRGHSQAASAALHRSVEIANARGDHLNEMRLLGPLFFYHFRNGEFRICTDHARRSSDIAARLNDSAATALANTLLGISLNISGHLSEAQMALDTALEAASGSPSSRRIHFGFDHHNWVRVTRITTLFLQGYPAQASAMISEAFKDAKMMHHPVAFALVINSTATLLWMGDLRAAEEHIEWLTSRAQLDSFGPYLHVAYAFKAELAICRGQNHAGVELLQSRLKQLHLARYELFTARLQSVLARGLAANGRLADALSLLDETEQLIDEKGYTCFLPEILRLKGNLLLASPEGRTDDAESCLVRSLEVSRSQGARAWELRAATDLAAHWSRQGRTRDAREVLRPVFDQFAEDLDTPDLSAAKDLLATLG
jgi:predicted ATPase